MRVYQLTDRDFEEFYALMEKIEFENRMKHGHSCKTSPCNECDLSATYRYNFLGWRNRVMGGDTYFRGPDAPRDNMNQYIKQEIDRLTKLLLSTDIKPLN